MRTLVFALVKTIDLPTVVVVQPRLVAGCLDHVNDFTGCRNNGNCCQATSCPRAEYLVVTLSSTRMVKKASCPADSAKVGIFRSVEMELSGSQESDGRFPNAFRFPSMFSSHTSWKRFRLVNEK